MEHVLSKYIQNPQLIDEISVDNLEDWISKEPFNVVLQLIFSYKMGNLRKDHSDFAVRNTLYPYLLGGISNTHISPNYTDENLPVTEGEKVFEVESKVHLEESLPPQPTTDDEINESLEIPNEELLPSDDLEKVILPSNEEIQTQNMVEPTLSHQIYIPEEPEVNKKLKHKRDQNTSDDHAVSSAFTNWVLSKKPIGTPSHFSKKKKKKEHIHVSAQKSITRSEDIISESLAKILKTQGHLLEAKKMFKKLIVQLPENTQKYIKEIEDINTLMEDKA